MGNVSLLLRVYLFPVFILLCGFLSYLLAFYLCSGFLFGVIPTVSPVGVTGDESASAVDSSHQIQDSANEGFIRDVLSANLEGAKPSRGGSASTAPVAKSQIDPGDLALQYIQKDGLQSARGSMDSSTANVDRMAIQMSSYPRSAKVLASSANIRSRPSMDSRILAKSPRGRDLVVLDKSGDWSLIRYETRDRVVDGYILSSLLEESVHEDSSSYNATLVSKVAKAKVLASSANIRSRPSMDSRILAKSPRGAILNVLEQRGNWSLVEYNARGGSVKGYVLYTLLERI